MIGLQKIFKIIDDNNSHTLDIQEFWKAINDFRVKISEEECRQLFDLFDENDDGVLDYDELLRNVKGPMNDKRKTVVKRAFDKLDMDKSSLIETNEIKKHFNPSRHPDVKAGTKTEDEVILDFISTFEAHQSMSKNDNKSKLRDGKVTLNEFLDYYSNVSASIDDDEYFELMVVQAWNLDNRSYAKGWGAEF